jgi:hypothetical protein
VTPAAGLVAAPLWLAAAAAGAPALDAPAASQKIAVEVRGPIALVTVTRPLACEPAARPLRPHPLEEAPPDEALNARLSCEDLLDVALPDGAALVDVALSERGRWRTLEVAPRERATHDYLAALPFPPAREPYDDGTTFRVRVASERSAARAVRYRFSLLPETSEGRRRIRFPGSPEQQPVPADVTTSIAGAREVTIAGTRATRARTSTRSGWEISWLPRASRARVEAGFAWTRLPPRQTISVVSVEAHGKPPVPPPPSVLFLIDRSRSVGLAGLSAERDLAGRLLEALPPSTRFDVLFFDRGVRRLFPMTRPATREALGAIDAEMVPDRMRNGTDLSAALREAGALLRREASAFAPRAWLVVITDGALSERDGQNAQEAALGATPGIDLQVATFVVRPADDDPAPAEAIHALLRLPSLHSGLLRELRANELGEAVPPALAALAQGGDALDVRWFSGGPLRLFASRLAPGEGLARVIPLEHPPTEISAWAGGARVRLALSGPAGDAAWLRPLARAPGASDARFAASDAVVALVETPTRPALASDAVHGSLDRTVVRNTLALAYMPRARACYLNRTAATPVERDLQGRVRLAIDLTRGEVGNVVVESSTLHHPGIEACLRDSAFELEVPRTLRSDSPSTAILNLVFRPRTPEKHESADEAALGDQIDLVIEELHRSEPAPAEEAPAADRSMIPTR